MVKRSLSALQYPQSDSVNVNDENHFRKVIVWLEENKIKKPDSALKNVNAPNWNEIYDKYKQQLGCPKLSNRVEELEWFLGYALHMEYSKNKDTFNKHAVANLKTSNVPSVVAENPLDKLDFRSKEFADEINNVASMLKISSHPDPLVTLKAINKVITSRLTVHAIENPQQYIVKGTPFPFEELDYGFNLNDPVLNKAAKVLRMLYIQNLRDLQTRANELIVAVQNVTANPKTDTKLGKVGK